MPSLARVVSIIAKTALRLRAVETMQESKFKRAKATWRRVNAWQSPRRVHYSVYLAVVAVVFVVGLLAGARAATAFFVAIGVGIAPELRFELERGAALGRQIPLIVDQCRSPP
jgi:hypothetical protein